MGPQEAWRILEQADCLYQASEVESALDAMAASMSHALADLNPILVCIMNGGMVPFGKLLPRLHFPLQVDYVHVTRYRERLKGGDLHWLQGPHVDVRDRVVVLVDDILDEGTTLAAIEDRFRKEGAKAVHKAVLIIKNRSRTHNVNVEFAGLEVPNRYVFGYGMDYKGYLRNAPGIYAEPEAP
ncbi:MAG: hypoxanthine-guanine phosphoribosyltransferase [Acidiferrobacterales bacterium]|nr:hypoxanthine-guanine phosphoribosyltransferase [Acidiferrobacterales bacterium]